MLSTLGANQAEAQRFRRTLILITSQAPRFPTMLAKLESSAHGTHLGIRDMKKKRGKEKEKEAGGREVYIVVKINRWAP